MTFGSFPLFFIFVLFLFFYFSTAESLAGEVVIASPSAQTVVTPDKKKPETPATLLPYRNPITQIVVNISVNTMPKGDFFVELDEGGNLFLKAEDLKTLKLNYAEDRAVLMEGELHVPVSAVRDVKSVFDEKKLTLAFIGKTGEAQKTSVEIYSLLPKPQNIYYPRETSAFLNYGLSYSYANPLGFQSFTGTNKLGLRAGDVFFVSDSLYTKTEQNTQFVRLQSSATYERRDDLQWFTLGDEFASSGDLGSTLNLGGVGFSKVYKLDPYFITQPVFDLKGTTIFPSQAEIYLDGMLVSKQQLPPGSFDFRNIYSYTGSHNVEVLLRDPFGNEQRISFPTYFNTLMLRQGLHEYSYNAGFLRERYGVKSDDYGKAAFSAFHRYGVTNSLNIGARAEGSDGTYNGGLFTSYALPGAGAFAVSLAESDSNGTKGAAASLQHSYQFKSFNTNLLVRGFSRDYSTVSAPAVAGRDMTKYEMNLGAGFLFMPLGNFSLGYSKSRTYGGLGTRTATANYSRGLSNTASLFVTASTTRQLTTTNSIFTGLNFSFDKNIRGSAQYNKTGGTDTEAVQVQKDVPVGEGLGYRASLNRTDTGASVTNSLSPFVQYNAKYGIYALDSSIQNSVGRTTEAYRASAAGSFVYAGGFYGLARPVSDSFGIVMVDKVPNATVLNNGQEIGKTGPSGTLVVPTLTSYGQNQITLDVKNIPLDYSISGVNKSLSPSLWSGSCVAFNAVKMQAITGSLFVVRDSKKEPVEYQEGTLAIGTQKVVFPTGKGGEFYIEDTLPKEVKESQDPLSCRAIAERRAAGGRGIKPGTYTASIDFEGQKCVFQVTFPETEDMITDLGQVECELRKTAVPIEPVAAPKEEKTVPLVPAPAAVEKPALKGEDNPPQSFVMKLSFGKNGMPSSKKDKRSLALIARILKNNPGLAVEIEVYGDRHGTGEASLRVGTKKAEEIRHYLIASGVKAGRIRKAMGFGKKKLICAEPTALCDKINRRGVIRIVQGGARVGAPATEHMQAAQ